MSPALLAILQMWRANLAIELEVLQMEWATFIEELYQDQFQIFALGWIADYPDPENFLDSLFHSLSSDNNLGYSDDEVDRLLDDASRELNQESRYDLYQGAEQLILDDAPIVPLWHSNEGYVLVKPNVKDYFLLSTIIPRLRYVYISE